MNKKIRLFLALLLAFVMCLAFVNFASAAVDPTQINKAAITKKLVTPYGVDITLLQARFTFRVRALSVSGTNYNPASANMPLFGESGTINTSDGSGTFSVGYGTTRATWTKTASDWTAPDYPDTYFIETGDIFAGYTWTSPGDYLYEITENPNTYTQKGIYPNPNSDKMEYSPAVYRVTVYVRAYVSTDIIPPGKQVGDIYIYGIGAIRVTTEGGTPGSEKVDPTPGTDREDMEYSGMTFTNKYGKVNGNPGGGDPDPRVESHRTLYVRKAVAGNTGDSSKYFNFEMTINNPTVVSGSKTVYRAYVVDTATGTIVTSTANGAASGNNYIEFTAGYMRTFSLRHGQSLVFVDTPVGMWYSITEKASDHIPSAIAVYDAGANTPLTAGLANTDYVLPGTMPQAVRMLMFVGERLGGMSFTNTRTDGGPITGLNINDLPFVGLIALAAGALVVFVVAKSRKRRRNYN